MLPQFAPPVQTDTTADTLQAVDTLSLGEQLRADSTIFRITDPSAVGGFLDRLGNSLLDVTLWIGVLGTMVHIVLIAVLAWFGIYLVDRVTDRWQHRFEALPTMHPRRQRAYTIGNLTSSTARYVIWPLALIMVLSEINVDVGALIATAGIAGLAIGFGAQTLVKDVISGVFLLFDDSIHVGDLVRIGEDAGTVEYIGIRLIKVRRLNGELLMVPAGELRIFGNRSIGFARALVIVGLSYEQDIETVLPVMERVANQWAEEHADLLLDEPPAVHSITDFAESSITARILVKVRPGEQFEAERALRLRLKREFDLLGIEIPFPRRTVYMRNESTLPPRSVFDPEAGTPSEPNEGSD